MSFRAWKLQSRPLETGMKLEYKGIDCVCDIWSLWLFAEMTEVGYLTAGRSPWKLPRSIPLQSSSVKTLISFGERLYGESVIVSHSEKDIMYKRIMKSLGPSFGPHRKLEGKKDLYLKIFTCGCIMMQKRDPCMNRCTNGE